MRFFLRWFLFGLFSFVLFPVFSTNAIGVSFVSLSPSSGNIPVGQTLKVNLNIDTGAVETTGADVVITFDPSVLQATDVSWGTLFQGIQPNPVIDNTIGKIILHPTSSSAANSFSGRGLLSTISFKGKSFGTSKINFVCESDTTQNDSNIWSNGEDIISCLSTSGGEYAVGAGKGSVLAETTTAAPDETLETATPTPAILMEAGSTQWTFLVFASGIVFLGLGSKLLFLKNN